MTPEALERARQAPVTLAGKCFYYAFPYRRRVLFSNLHQVYGEALTGCEKKHLAQAFYSHLAKSLKELCWVRFMRQETLKARVEVHGEDHLLQLAAEGKGALLLTAHVGNWEFAPLGAMLNFKSFSGHFHFIRRSLQVKWLEKLLFKRYYQAGLRIIPKKGSLDQVCEVLTHSNAVIFVLDQHASLANRDGIAVEFFGKKAGTYRSLASLARHTQLPVIPVTTYRRPDDTHVLAFLAPIPWTDYPTSQEALYYNTKRYNEALEQLILAHPEQWMWVHKRWKLASFPP